MSDKELKVMESKVREAMGSCSEAQRVLQFLFNSQLTPPEQEFEVGDIVEMIHGIGDYARTGDLGIFKKHEEDGLHVIEFFLPGTSMDCNGWTLPNHGCYVRSSNFKLRVRPKK